ncbi:MAG: type II toxin-antitoxin system HicB family antitoxin [Chloroflexi bacterium]|nr:type II toxin-antitoxin system HicB family antitoxin [Chloroflexota bacterium]
MSGRRQFTAVIEREGNQYVALCPDLDIASQGDTVEDARRNLTEAVQMFFECADEAEIEGRLHTEVYVTRIEVEVA